MKKMTVYEINDGVDGTVVAKSLKQAVKILSKMGYQQNKLLHDLKINLHEEMNWDILHNKTLEEYIITDVYKTLKKGKCRKARILGFADC